MIWITTVFAVFLAKEYDSCLVQFKTQWFQETNTGCHPVWMGDNWEDLHKGKSQMLQNKTKRRTEAEFLVWQQDLALTITIDPVLSTWLPVRFWKGFGFRLQRERIQWLVDKLQEELERNTARSCPLSRETQVRVVLLSLLLSFRCMKSACLQLHIITI